MLCKEGACSHGRKKYVEEYVETQEEKFRKLLKSFKQMERKVILNYQPGIN